MKNELSRAFNEIFGTPATTIVCAPGRAEIIGNHTDYNLGFALAAGIEHSIWGAFAARSDGKVVAHSSSFPGQVIEFSLTQIEKDPATLWGNYIRGVIAELQQEVPALQKSGGISMFFDANLPFSGGVSSSAAFELCIATGVLAILGEKVSDLTKALLCKRAENGAFVETPCGLLDQASVALAQKGKLLLLDFMPNDTEPCSYDLISADLKGARFVISVDSQVKRNLGETGYPIRRKACEESLPILADYLKRPIQALRQVSCDEFEDAKEILKKKGSAVLADRVEHIVYENQRVIDAVLALQAGDIEQFATLLTQSGESALRLYGLDEKTPELTHLLASSLEAPGVMGSRNMGGGFSAIILSLVRADEIPAFKAALSKSYSAQWGRELEYLDFEPAAGARIM